MPYEKEQEFLDRFHFDPKPRRVISPLTDGKSAAQVYIVRMKRSTAVVKIEKQKNNEAIEAEIHNKARNVIANRNNLASFIPEIIDYKTVDDWHGVLYQFAGNSKSYTINSALMEENDEYLESVMPLLSKFIYNWNEEHDDKSMKPFHLVKQTMGYRFMDDKLLNAFSELNVSTDDNFITFHESGMIFPNPAKFFTHESLWQDTWIECTIADSHGDFHGNNIIVLNEQSFSVIDFAEYQTDTNIFYDERYLELHVLMDSLSFQTEGERQFWHQLCSGLTGKLHEDPYIPNMKGSLILRTFFTAIRRALRDEFADEHFLSLCEPSYYLAGVAAGLNVVRKTPDPLKKFAAFIYTAYNLQAAITHEEVDLDLPNEQGTPLHWPKPLSASDYLLEEDIYSKKVNRLFDIINNRDLTFAVQPIVHLQTGKVEAVEFLCRDPKEILMPDEIFQIARNQHKLSSLTILGCEKLVTKVDAVKPFIHKGIFVNLEADLTLPVLEQSIKKLLSSKEQVVIEVTEYERKALAYVWRGMADEEGFSIAIDDFGRKQSSMEEVSTMKPDYIKVVIDDINTYGPAAIKHYMEQHKESSSYPFEQLEFVVEKIEHADHIKQAVNAGMQYGQGYYFSRPCLIDEVPVEEWLEGFYSKLIPSTS
ncbi:EAL domain, c-di-GMP-specific phosphodiesterase class I (or its enzymatically inactive variant) [Alteribacillus persepolensis]|uniref:EAL domain, c-di-GMP-specific phosphodiesterase class I (Or its enzymatically inactive variant) n=1 Tax=Alteribacillus persepolensis TaxID=568899 RepID=A0A1G8F882_9BACI|nr:EAL domain-containing protein [Alteribacillus persepolensis]SDH78285.1 EAL domain, c-di-GMP-specific phosphodiesterase class I (or its enzymatically inactive variant) [Alteribacillus persepolensis]